MTEQELNPPDSLVSMQAIQMAGATPWKAWNEVWRLLALPMARWRLRGVECGRGWKCYGLPIIQKHRDSVMRIGDNLNLRSSVRSNPLGPNHPVILSTRRANTSLIIGDDFGMTGGSIVVEEQVTIGNRVTVGANTVISDTDFHPLDPQIRQQRPIDGATAPIVIEDDVFIGMQCLILKGVTIGARAVSSARGVW